MLSALITVPPNSSAIASASPDLPLAVGPLMRMRGGLRVPVLAQPQMPFAALAFAALAFTVALADNGAWTPSSRSSLPMTWRASTWCGVSRTPFPRCATGCTRSAPMWDMPIGSPPAPPLISFPARVDESAQGICSAPGAAALVATMRAHGASAALVSGGFSIFAGVVQRALAFDETIANTLLVENGSLTGLVREPFVTGEAKLAALKRLAAERALPLAASLAVRDRPNDLPIIPPSPPRTP